MNARRPNGAYGNMATRFSSMDVIRRLLRSGPRSAADLAEMGEFAPHDVMDFLARLIKLREVEKVKVEGRHADYRLVKPAVPPVSRAALRAMEDTYVAARKRGDQARDLAQRMDLSATSAERFEASFRAQTTSGSSFDSSCPKFAKHEEHLKSIAGLGSFPAMASAARGRVQA